MKKADSASILASFATLKSLSDGKRYSSAYQLLSEFIHYIIYTKSIFSFTSIEMKNRLSSVFGFELPEAVVKTAAKSLPYLSKKNGIYTVNQKIFVPNKSLEEAKNEEENRNSIVIDLLEKYIAEKDPEKTIVKEQLTRDLVAFLIDGNQKASGQYLDLISEFVLKKEHDDEVQECLKKIREGSILYIGLTYNINETGSFKKQLTLFLDTEILFSLVGYNGEIYKILAQDFYTQVKSANSNGDKIKLTYFPNVEKEIDDFFKTASSIVEGKTQSIEKPAMAAIINGCTTSADVEVKKADFFHVLSFSYGIYSDTKTNYYTDEDIEYNLESMDHTDPKDQESWRFISHINKLRKAQLFFDNTEAEYLFITNTYNTIKISKEYTDMLKEDNALESICDYAITLDRITNIIWYKLGNGFGKKEYPSNVNVILKARIALASYINHNVEQVYSDTREKFYTGEITEEQLAARIITLRKKPTLPEEIEGDLIEESIDFSTEYLLRFEEEVKSNIELIKEKDQIINDLKEQNQLELVKKDTIIAERDQTIEIQKEQNRAMEAELAEFHRKEEQTQRRKQLVRNILLFSWSIIWKLLIVVGVTVLAVIIENHVDNNIPIYVCAVIDLVGVIYTILNAVIKDYKKCFYSK